VLLDVREPDELAICKLAGSVSIPMRELAARAGELDRDSEIVCVCHHGLRSAQVAAWLASAGFDRVHNLSGGLEAWACEIDPWMKRY
jgi:rhodanese-related sulfurtransferase